MSEEYPNLPTSLDLKCNPSYSLAYQDEELMDRPELRPVRLMMEAIKPELTLDREHIDSTIVVFGSARIVDPEKAKHILTAAEMLLEEKPKDSRRRKRVRSARFGRVQER